MVEQNGISINQEKENDVNRIIDKTDFKEGFIIIQKGKKVFLKVILEKYGSDMDHVVKIDVLLSKWEYRTEMNEEYVKHFKKDK